MDLSLLAPLLPDALLPWLAGAWAVYLLLLSGWIVLQKREPVATLSWVLALAALPVLGFVVYHLLGPQRIRRQTLRRGRSRAALAAPRPRAEGELECPPLLRLGEAATGFAPSSCHAVDLLVGGAATYDALLEAIAGARDHIHLEYYIVQPDRTGTALRDALVAKARAGVRVRWLMDALGSSKVSNAFLAPLLAAGGEVGWFHRMRLRRLWRPTLNMRTHRKIVVVDGAIGFTGGINVCDEQDQRLDPDAHDDLHLRMDGAAVHWLQLAFLEDWHYATGVALRAPALFPEAVHGPVEAQVLPAGPDSPWEPIHRMQVAAIHAARQRVWLCTPYFVPGEAARMALQSAAMRGVDVRVYVPRRSDSLLTTLAARSYFDELREAGVRVFEYLPRMLHAKALLVDEDVAIVGSANFDPRSFRLNFELAVLFLDAGVAGQLAGLAETVQARSREVRGARALRLPARLAEAVARLCSPLL